MQTVFWPINLLTTFYYSLNVKIAKTLMKIINTNSTIHHYKIGLHQFKEEILTTKGKISKKSVAHSILWKKLDMNKFYKKHKYYYVLSNCIKDYFQTETRIRTLVNKYTSLWFGLFWFEMDFVQVLELVILKKNDKLKIKP